MTRERNEWEGTEIARIKVYNRIERDACKLIENNVTQINKCLIKKSISCIALFAACSRATQRKQNAVFK